MMLIVTPEVATLGICVAMARFGGAKVSNRSNPLEKRKKEALDAIRAIDIEAHPVLAAYRELHRLAGVEGVVPPAQHLISLAKANGRLPNSRTRPSDVQDGLQRLGALVTETCGGTYEIVGQAP